MHRWRGRELEPKEQVANACDSFPDLTPASETPAEQVRAGWAACLPGQEIPLIKERRYGREPEEDDFC